MSLARRLAAPASTRHLVGVVVVAFWLVMMALLVHRELAARRHAPAPANDVPEAGESWLAIELGEERIGFVHLTREFERRRHLPGLAVRIDGTLALRLLGHPAEVALAGSSWRSRDGRLAELDFRLRSGENDFRIVGTVRDGELAASVSSGGERFPLKVALGDGAVLTDAFGSSLSLPRLAVGEEAVVDSFDPVTLGRGRVRLRCLAEETRTVAGERIPVHVLAVTASGVETKAWVAADGEVVRAETPFGLVLEKVDAATARAFGAGDSADLLEHTAVHPTGQRPFRGARRMVVRLGGTAGELELPTDDSQHALANGRIRIEPLGPAVGEAEQTSGPTAADTTADALAQSDSPAIRSQAAAIVGDETDPWRKALLIHAWVYRTIDKVPVPSVPSALAVLATKRGDCNEHTVLFTALARAAGVPARMAIGIVWSEEGKAFFYHAWPEVWVGRWVWMDPTLGEKVADATHIKLVSGGIERWPRLVPYLGRLTVEVEEVE